jgi:hypothetical protein
MGRVDYLARLCIGQQIIESFTVGYGASLRIIAGFEITYKLYLSNISWELFSMNDVVLTADDMYNSDKSVNLEKFKNSNEFLRRICGGYIEDLCFDFDSGMISIGFSGPYFLLAKPELEMVGEPFLFLEDINRNKKILRGTIGPTHLEHEIEENI